MCYDLRHRLLEEGFQVMVNGLTIRATIAVLLFAGCGVIGFGCAQSTDDCVTFCNALDAASPQKGFGYCSLERLKGGMYRNGACYADRTQMEAAIAAAAATDGDADADDERVASDRDVQEIGETDAETEAPADGEAEAETEAATKSAQAADPFWTGRAEITARRNRVLAWLGWRVNKDSRYLRAVRSSFWLKKRMAASKSALSWMFWEALLAEAPGSRRARVLRSFRR